MSVAFHRVIRIYLLRCLGKYKRFPVESGEDDEYTWRYTAVACLAGCQQQTKLVAVFCVFWYGLVDYVAALSLKFGLCYYRILDVLALYLSSPIVLRFGKIRSGYRVGS